MVWTGLDSSSSSSLRSFLYRQPVDEAMYTEAGTSLVNAPVFLSRPYCQTFSRVKSQDSYQSRLDCIQGTHLMHLFVLGTHAVLGNSRTELCSCAAGCCSSCSCQTMSFLRSFQRAVMSVSMLGTEHSAQNSTSCPAHSGALFYLLLKELVGLTPFTQMWADH